MAQHPPQTVFHAAACKHVPLVEQNPLAGIETNVLGTRRLLDASVSTAVRQFILVSTDKAVRPQGVMGATKRLAELLVQDKAREAAITRFAIVRFGNVLGSSGSVLPLFREQVARGGPVTVTDPEATRYFMTPDEAIDLLLASVGLAERRFAPTFVPRMGRAISMRHFAEGVIREAGLRPRDENHPDGDIEITSIGLRSGEKLHEELHLSACPRPTAQPRILRLDEPSLSPAAMARALEELDAAFLQGNETAGREALFRWAKADVEAAAPLPPRWPMIAAAPRPARGPARGPHLMQNATGGG
jgi:FlaA1/EpsC-like NDP-sugar epimerase